MGRRSQGEVAFPSHRVEYTVVPKWLITGGVDLDLLAEVTSVRFLHSKVTLSSAPHPQPFPYSWEEVTKFGQPFRTEELYSTWLRAEWLQLTILCEYMAKHRIAPWIYVATVGFYQQHHTVRTTVVL